MRWGKWAAIAAVCAACAGCMHPDLLQPGVTRACEVRAGMGEPSREVKTPEGTRFVYTWAGSREVWWVLFDKAGRFVSASQVMDDGHFALLAIGKTTKSEVLDLFGTPDEEYSFRLSGTTAYNYPYWDYSSRPMRLWVEFTDDVVTSVACVDDDRSADADWL